MTGAAGRLGSVISAELRERGHDVTGVDVEAAEGVTVADVCDTDVLAELIEDHDAVAHFAGFAGERDFQTAIDSHITSTYSVLEAMRRSSVPRIVYASSAHAVGFTPRTENLEASVRPRPDTLYGVGKVAAEALCSLYVDRYKIAAACLRIGAFLPAPQTRRHLSIWLSPGDAGRLVDACLTAPDLRFATVHGISANTRRWWSLDEGYQLGYHPRDNAEDYAETVLNAPETERDVFEAAHVGGRFCSVP